jgi:uncharacterized membrane protein
MSTPLLAPPAWPQRVAFGAVLALVVGLFVGSALLAPLRPGRAWFADTAVPLGLLLPGLARGARRARQWLCLLLPFYFAEGLVRTLTEHGRHALCAGVAAALAAVAFVLLLRGFADRGRTGDARRTP